MKLQHSQAVALMVGVTALWSMAGVVTRQLEHARSFEVTFWRSFFTLLSLLVILPVWQGKSVLIRLPWKNRYFWLSGVCWCVMFTAFMLALTLTAVANVLITMALGPLFTALISRFVMGQRLPFRTWVAIAVAGAGITWMYASQWNLGDPQFLLGTLVALCVPIAGSVQWTLAQKSHSQGLDLDLVPSVMLGAGLSCAATLPLAMPFQASAHDLGLLALLGLFQLAIPCALAVVCARVLQAPEVALLALLEIVFGIALAWLGANEAPQWSVLMGGTLVLGALVANECFAWRTRNV